MKNGHIQIKLAGILAALFVMVAAAPAFAAGGGGEFPWGHWAVSIANVIIFVGIIAYFAGGRINDYYADRREGLLADLKESKRLREEAEAKFEEYSAKLDALEEERKALLDEYHKEGEAEKERMVEEAKQQVEKMRSDAELVIQQEVRKAVAAIEAQAVDLALGMAQKRLEEKVTDGTQNVLVDNYVHDLNESGAQA